MTGLFEFGAGNEIRTRDPNLGKVVLYQLSYSRNADRLLPTTEAYSTDPDEAVNHFFAGFFQPVSCCHISGNRNCAATPGLGST